MFRTWSLSWISWTYCLLCHGFSHLPEPSRDRGKGPPVSFKHRPAPSGSSTWLAGAHRTGYRGGLGADAIDLSHLHRPR